MYTLDDLLSLINATGLDFEKTFRDVHHFAQQPPFQTAPLGFTRFVTYCQGLRRGILPGQENEQTIQRAYRYIKLRENMSHKQALAQAWNEFPLRTLGR